MNRLSQSLDFEAKPGAHDVSGIPPTYHKTEVPRKVSRALRLSLIFGSIGALLIPVARIDDNRQINQQTKNPTPECLNCDKPPTPQKPSQENLTDFLLPNVDPKFVIPPDFTPAENNDTLQIA